MEESRGWGWGGIGFIIGITLQTLLIGWLDKAFGFSVPPMITFAIPVCCTILGIVAGCRYDQFLVWVECKHGEDWVKILAVIELTVIPLILGLCVLLLFLSPGWFM